MNTLEIIKLSEGGYVVRSGPSSLRPQYEQAYLFACTRLDEALGYIQDKLEPIAE
jgi:hypothetical protein